MVTGSGMMSAGPVGVVIPTGASGDTSTKRRASKRGSASVGMICSSGVLMAIGTSDAKGCASS